MNLSAVVKILKADHNFVQIIDNNHDWHYILSEELADIKIKDLSYDSRAVDSQTLFFAKGNNFKSEYLIQAIKAGLKFYVAEEVFDLAGESAVGIIVKDVRQAMAIVAREFFGNPQEKLKIIAITGTKGKTTTAYFVKGMLQEKCAMLSTQDATLDGGKSYFKSKLTTPESIDLYRMISIAVANKMNYLVMEVSSQAYKLKRVYGLTFDVGIFLNISPDHIGPLEHPSFMDYLNCKRQIFYNSKNVILNRNTDYFELLTEEITQLQVPTYFYGTTADGTNYYQEKLSNHSFVVKGGKIGRDDPNLAGEYSLKLLGDFNHENALAALIAVNLVTTDLTTEIQQRLADVIVPGRMETIFQSNGAEVIVDYAHNRLSLTNLLKFARVDHQGKMIVVIGSTGSKGISRRKDFGEVLNELADHVILTADDPNFDDPVQIAQEIAQYIVDDAVKVEIIPDRITAIRTALKLSTGVEDVVVLAGKGADKFQIVNGEKQDYPGDMMVLKESFQLI